MSKVTEATTRDLLSIDPVEGMFPALERALPILPSSKPFMVLKQGDEPMCVLGIMPTRPRNGTAWALVDKAARKRHVVQLCRIVRTYIGLQGTYDRIEAPVRSDFTKGIHMAQACGLSAESLMRKYGHDGSDHIMFVWVREDER